jgi:hypothetical protein
MTSAPIDPAELGTAVSLAAGAGMDVSNAQICEDFDEDMREELTPEKFALVAEISEDSTTPVDYARRRHAVAIPRARAG